MMLNDHRFLILAALARGPRHGYGMVEEIVELTGGATRPRAGALYHALDRLVTSALVATEREEVVDGRLRKYYVLTDSGRRLLATEAIARKHTAEAALARLAPGVTPA